MTIKELKQTLNDPEKMVNLTELEKYGLLKLAAGYIAYLEREIQKAQNVSTQ